MNYSPGPGTVAFRVLAHLQTLPHGTEVLTAALADAIRTDHKNIAPCMEQSLAAGLVFRRRRDSHRTSPLWWSRSMSAPTVAQGGEG